MLSECARRTDVQDLQATLHNPIIQANTRRLRIFVQLDLWGGGKNLRFENVSESLLDSTLLSVQLYKPARDPRRPGERGPLGHVEATDDGAYATYAEDLQPVLPTCIPSL